NRPQPIPPPAALATRRRWAADSATAAEILPTPAPLFRHLPALRQNPVPGPNTKYHPPKFPFNRRPLWVLSLSSLSAYSFSPSSAWLQTEIGRHPISLPVLRKSSDSNRR